MSGSPIIRNGKLVGAVAHVLVEDPERGYGVSIEEMPAKVESTGYDGKKRRPYRLRFFPAVARRQQFSRDLQKRLSFGGEKLYNILQCFILGRAGP